MNDVNLKNEFNSLKIKKTATLTMRVSIALRFKAIERLVCLPPGRNTLTILAEIVRLSVAEV